MVSRGSSIAAVVIGLWISVGVSPSVADVPEVVRIELEQGDRHREAGRMDDAAASYRQAIELGPDVAEAYLALGAIHHGEGDLEASLGAFEQGLEVLPDNVQLRYNAAVTALRLERYGEALGHTDSALESGQDADLQALRSAILARLDRPEEALEALGKALRQKKGDPQLLFRQGNLQHALGRNADAVDSFRRAIRADGRMLRAYYNLGAVLFEMENFDEALDAYAKALEPIDKAFAKGDAVEPIHARAYANLGAIYVGREAWPEASEAYSKAVQLDPQLTDALYNLAFIQFRDKRYDAAFGNYTRVLERNAELPLAYLHLAEIHALRGEHDQAIQRLEDGLDQLTGAERLAALELLAESQLEEGRADAAEAAYRQVLDADPEHPDAPLALGRLLRQANRLEEAAEFLDRARRLRPSDNRAVLELAAVAQRRGDRSTERALYEDLLNASTAGTASTLWPVRLRLALLLLGGGDTDAAKPHLEALGKQAKKKRQAGGMGDADRDLITTLQGLVSLAEGDLNSARGTLRSVAERVPAAADALALLAMRAGETESAVDRLQAAAERAVDDPAHAANLGQALWWLGRGEAAKPHLERASRSLPLWPSLHGALGDLALAAGDLDAARRHLERAEALCANGGRVAAPSADGSFRTLLAGDPAALCDWVGGRLGALRVGAELDALASTLRRGSLGNARRNIDKALAESLSPPLRAAALYVRGTLALAGGDLAPARRDLQTALGGDLPVALRPLAENNLGVALIRSGQAEDASRAFERARVASGAPTAATLNLGILLEDHLGDGRGALEHYETYRRRGGARATEVEPWIERLRRIHP